MVTKSESSPVFRQAEVKLTSPSIGACTALVKTSTPAASCKLAVDYVEEVTNPGQALPGCNPIVDTNPAPVYAPAALGIASSGPCSAAQAAAKPATIKPRHPHARVHA